MDIESQLIKSLESLTELVSKHIEHTYATEKHFRTILVEIVNTMDSMIDRMDLINERLERLEDEKTAEQR